MTNLVLIDRDHLQELVDCANIPDIDPVYQVDVCVECDWRATTNGDLHLPNVDKHKVGCAKQAAIMAAMEVLA